MPTETTFRNVALALDELADDADDLVYPVAAALDAEVLRGGRFTDDVRRAVDRSAAIAAQVAASCRSAADESRRRADACDAFTRELEAWELADDRHQRALSQWEGRQRAHVDDPLHAPPAGPRPRAPEPRPQPGYGWIG